ncbi:hypothetical protein [Fontibacillus sp. BL9]|uniref:hypothetical protein n=1 Tax=Fontibacillus sp. BL9 TaxID=3389971 RepID=UPI00397A951E
MRRFQALLLNDIRHTFIDPVLMAGIFGPLALLLITRFGYPTADMWIEAQYSFDIELYSDFTVTLLISVIPMLTGMLTGLLMLDERDEDVISYYAVTPLMRKGYLIYRFCLPSMLCLVFSMLYLLFSGVSRIGVESVYVLFLLALEAPWFGLFLAAFSANKVEGLALSKIGGLFIAGPVIASFVPGAWKLLGAWIPTYWPAKVHLAGVAGNLTDAAGYFLAGLAVHGILIYLMIRIFIKRMD